SSNGTSVAIQGDSVRIRAVASFQLGSGSSCPDVEDYTLTVINNSIELNLFYNLSGAWASEFCTSVDTVYLTNLNPDNYTLHLIANSIEGLDTILNVSDITVPFGFISGLSNQISSKISL